MTENKPDENEEFGVFEKKLDALSSTFLEDDFDESAPNEEEDAFGNNGNYDKALKEQQYNQSTDIHKLRQDILPKLFWSAVVWVVFVAFILIISSMRFGEKVFFALSDTVLIALMTTTTTTILGLFGIAAAWLFPKK